MNNQIASNQVNESPSPASLFESTEDGYIVDKIEEIHRRFKCQFCEFVIRNPVQLTECGHRCCQGCFETQARFSADGSVICSSDECGETSNRSQIMLDKAFKRELDALSVVCRHRIDQQCPWTGRLKNYQAHLDENHVNYICPECDERLASNQALQEHITKTCAVIFQSCPLGAMCTEQLIRKTEFSHHLASKNHQETLLKFLSGEYTYPDVSQSIEDTNREAHNEHLKQEIDQKFADLTEQVRNVTEKTTKVKSEFESYNELLNSTAQKLNNIHSQLKERLAFRQSLQPNQEKVQKQIEQIEKTYEENEYIATDGTLTWRIDNVSDKIADAQSERVTSIYSPIFYSSPTGYKMRARLFLFGDGSARRTHISLFFLVMKGEYDAILKWPFSYKIIFSLFDQTGKNLHIIDSFYPDVKSNSFQRPKEAQNTASGIPKFFPLTMLLQDDNAYVRDNTMFLKIMVTLTDIPKTIVPYMLTLNPALPAYVQENLIQKESTKITQPTVTDNST